MTVPHIICLFVSLCLTGVFGDGGIPGVRGVPWAECATSLPVSSGCASAKLPPHRAGSRFLLRYTRSRGNLRVSSVVKISLLLRYTRSRGDLRASGAVKISLLLRYTRSRGNLSVSGVVKISLLLRYTRSHGAVTHVLAV